MAACLVVLFSGSFTSEKVSAALQVLAIPLSITAILALAGLLLRPLLPRESQQNRPVAPAAVKSLSRPGWLQLVLGLALLVFLVYGLVSGGTADVLAKAANICSECIGLG